MKLLRVVIITAVFSAALHSQGVPFLSGRVNDYAGILSTETHTELESVLAAHEKSTTDQIAVLTIQSLEGAVLEDYSIKVAETWKLGQKGKNNGVLLLIAKDDRKVRIEVGYGLESTLTDALCSQIIRREIVPRFKNGDFDGGVRAAVNAIIGTLGGTYVADTSSDDTETADTAGMLIGLLIFLAVVGTHSVFAILNKGFTSYFHAAFLLPFWTLFPMVFLGSSVGFIPVFLFIAVFAAAKIFFTRSPASQALQTRWAPRSSGGSSGGGWSSGGGGSSFSGGGGSFGGGGSSGSW